MKLQVLRTDYADPQQARDLAWMLECYARDPMGGGAALPASTRENLASELAKLPHAFSFLCYADGKPVGLINCFEGFSTFQCKPLVNVHDIVVLPECRGLGICQLMLAEVAEEARRRGCCKITLEVLEGNEPARAAYRKFGFQAYELDPAMGRALFWQMNCAEDSGLAAPGQPATSNTGA